ncbi:MAG: NifB/NifX family molybdenum-iron cluster-binding protein [Candidatus Lokiarchaeota archaeon]|nr:NifB/NifX family molybdenum-iron cluster-binding protein [Candidatus Lokiarchaeota archaeon]
MAKIAIPSMSGDGLSSQVDLRFGRAMYFTFVTVEDGKVKEVTVASNNAAQAMGGAGPQAVQFVIDHGADTVFVLQVGPNAAAALGASGAMVLTRSDTSPPPYTVKQIVDEYIAQKLVPAAGANVPSHAGMRMGRFG